MFVTPGTMPFGYKLTRQAASDIARNWWVLLLNGALLIVAGFLIFSIDWTIQSLATFIGALFIFQGAMEALTTGIDRRVRRANVVTGLLSIATGILISGTFSPNNSYDASSSPSRSYSRAVSQRSSCTTSSIRFDVRVDATPNKSRMLISPRPRTSM